MTVEDAIIEDRSETSGPTLPGPAAVAGAIATWLLSIAAIVVAAVHMGPVRSSAAAAVGHLRPEDPIDLLLAFVLSTTGAVIVVRGRSRRYGSIILGSGAALAVMQAAEEVAAHAVYVADSAPPHTDAAVWIQDQGLVAFAAIVLWLPAMFPDGVPVEQWRRHVHALTVGWMLLLVLFAFADRPAEHFFLDHAGAPDNPLGFIGVSVDALNVAWLVITIASFVVSVGSLRVRWRDAGMEQRQQLKWVLFAIGVTVAVLMVSMFIVVFDKVLGADTGLGWIETTLVPLSWVLVAVALGLGVLRYRLYDVDLVINRTVVYGVMSALVIATYVAVVSITAGILPDVQRAEASLLGTGLVAVGFAPVRSRVQTGVDHLLFGQRDDPLGVLTELGHHLTDASAPDAVLGTVVETMTASLKLPGAAIDLQLDGQWETRAVSGTVQHAEDAVEIVPLRYQGEVVGRMLVARRRRGEPLRHEDLRLVENIAHHAAALAHAVLLNVALQRSREQLVLAREEERRRLRRDLHDGLGPSLASQTFRLDAVLALIEMDPATAADHIRSLKELNRELVADIRRLVYELRPPALDELGLEGALRSHARQLEHSGALAVDVTIEPAPLGDLPAAVEVASFRIVAEALTNVARHAHATRCVVAIERRPRSVVISVVDDGVGMGGGQPPGVGLVSMRERAAELGGSIEIGTGIGGGTTVTAQLPLVPDPPTVDGRGETADVRTRVGHAGG